MARDTYRYLILATGLSLTLASFNAQGQPDDQHPTPVEIVQLPTFCWGQFGIPNTQGREFNMPPPTDCGWGMNHYCFGLIDLMRAKKATNKGARLGSLGLADANVRYTENAIKNYPKCSLREHIAASRAEIDKFMMIYNMKRRP